MSIDDELRRLFDDDRLELRPAKDAEAAIVSGAARRQRRRRAALAVSSAAAAVAVITGGLALSGVWHSPPLPYAGFDSSVISPGPIGSEVPPATPAGPTETAGSTRPDVADRPVPTEAPARTPDSRATSTQSRAGSSTAATSGSRTAGSTPLGPAGYGKVRLGMTWQQAMDTGELVAKDGSAAPKEGCVGLEFRDRLTGQVHLGGVVFSAALGVAAFWADQGTRTPENIGLGSTEAELKAAYPKAVKGPPGWSAPVAGNDKAYYTIGVTKGEVVQLGLALKDQDCFG